jgi:hypothetical protein
MRCTSVVVQYHPLPGQTFFKPVITQIQFSDRLLKAGVFLLEINYLVAAGLPASISSRSFFTGFKKVFAPAIIQITVDAFPATQLGYRRLTPQSIQNDADLFFSLKITDVSLSKWGHLLSS